MARSRALFPGLAVQPVPVRAGEALELTGLPEGPLTVELLSVLGQRLSVSTWLLSASRKLVRQAAPSQPGLYLLRLTTPGGRQTQRVLVE